jgi:hypothetical protein
MTNMTINIEYVLALPTIQNGNGCYWVADNHNTYKVDVDDDYRPTAITKCGDMWDYIVL